MKRKLCILLGVSLVSSTAFAFEARAPMALDGMSSMMMDMRDQTEAAAVQATDHGEGQGACSSTIRDGHIAHAHAKVAALTAEADELARSLMRDTRAAAALSRDQEMASQKMERAREVNALAEVKVARISEARKAALQSVRQERARLGAELAELEKLSRLEDRVILKGVETALRIAEDSLSKDSRIR